MAKLFGVHINLNQNEIQNVLIHKLASAPSTPVAGQMYYNTSGNEMYFYDGTAWKPWKANGVISVSINTTANGLSVNASTGAVTFTLALANGSSAGAMSSTHFNDLTNATASNTVSQIVKRDSNGNISISNPTNASHAATKQYVDNIATGLNIKASVKASTTANITLSGAQTVDGISCVANDRVLVKNQAVPSQNGVYIVSASTWTRATDYATGSNAASTFMFIEQGSTLGETGWVCTNDTGSAVVGTNSLAYTQFTGGASYTAGDGLTQVGNAFNVVAADASIIVNADNIAVRTDASTIETFGGGIRVKDAGITGAKLASAIFSTGLTFTSNVLTVTNYTPVTSTTVARKYVATSQTIGGGTATTITHNLNTTAVLVQVRDASTLEEIECDITTAANTVSVTALGSNRTVNIVVIG